jgi:hypothetical protein
MLNTLAITVHALAATVAFVAGLLAAPAGRFLGVYRSAMVVMAAALVPAVLVDWTTTDVVGRFAFGGLFLLSLGMVVRAELAARMAPERTGGPLPAYLGHVGFTLIALADGFGVVAVLRAGAPGWVIAAVAAGVVVVGHLGVEAMKRRLVRPVGSAFATP